MTTNEEDTKKVPDQIENPENPEEQNEEEEEPVDIELQKEMKGLKIEESDFANNPKTKKTTKKHKNPEDKKSKKKGQDFLDYANKNNIQINIEYEENKYQLKKKEDQKGGNKYNDNRKQFNKGGFKNNKNNQQKRVQMSSGNKFDNFVQLAPHQKYNQRPVPTLSDDKQILDHLEKFFSEANLNKNTYIRNRLKDNGKILVDDVAAYNDFKKNNINSQKIMEILKNSQTLELVTEENNTNYIKIKNFEKLNLISLEQIIENNRVNRMPKMTYPPMGGMPFYPPYGNFIAMQNNYYFPQHPYYGSQNQYYPEEESNK